ncbi:MAG: PAS domain-containing sensor histidine kinase [Spongiibacteraceae bacterium]|nr:PAS domain-containing sensor histidine kinase [Spongiibacteraceae bacterium]|tara:strand:- start:238 stop:1341 length:1104 start_codon:yes stop_codon:yes gene_type:complete
MTSTPLSDDRFNALIDAAADAILIIDHRAHIKVFNTAAEKLFQYESHEVLGKNIKVLMPEPYRTRHDDYIRRYLETGEARIIGKGREVQAIKKSGAIFPVELSVGEINSPDKSEFVGIIRDLSEKRAIEDQLLAEREQLAHVARLGTLGEIATGLAHELNQPLAAISTYSTACKKLIASGNVDDVDILAVLDDISGNAKRAGDIIYRLRALIGDDTAEQRAHSIKTLVEQSAKLAAPVLKAHNVTLENLVSDDIGDVFVDDIHIQQVFLNLIKNASEALEDTEMARRITISAHREANKLYIAVADNGPGIIAGAEQDIFQPFYSSKDEGLGVGLSLCKSLMKINDGQLTAHNNNNGGLTITMELPVA